MPRIARQSLGTSFFHVMVQGINKEYIFEEGRYIKRYIELMKQNLENMNVKIIAFCIMNNHAHLLINTDEIQELSKYMQRLNGMYARYYNYIKENRVGYVFRDRYKSEPILSKKQLLNCIKYIHQNPVKAGMVKKEEEYLYSSSKFYQEKIFKSEKNSIKNLFSKEEICYICNSTIKCKETFLDIDTNIEETIDMAIQEFIQKENVKLFEIFEKNDILKKLIKYMKATKKIKYTDIMKKLIISRGVMERLKK